MTIGVGKTYWESGPRTEDNCEAMDELLGDECPVCGGEGYIMACDGDGSDWGEDTYSGPMDATIKCRHCANGYLP